MAASAVIGREKELGSIETFLAEVEQRPAALVLSGEPGIGKTILWEAGVEEARERFGHVLSCRGVEAEALRSRSLDSQSCSAPCSRRAAPSLAPPRRRALEIALLLVEPGEDHSRRPRDRPSCARRAHASSPSRDPLVVAIDDVQWLDPASTGALQIAFRRLRGERVGLLATLLRAPPLATPFVFDRALSEERLTRISLGPMSLVALHGVLKERIALELTKTRARPLARGDSWQPVLRARARTRARPERHEAGGRPGVTGAGEPARAPRRSSRPVAGGDRRCSPPGRGARPADR